MIPEEAKSLMQEVADARNKELKMPLDQLPDT